jgi:hypothetical protein
MMWVESADMYVKDIKKKLIIVLKKVIILKVINNKMLSYYWEVRHYVTLGFQSYLCCRCSCSIVR